MRIAGFSQSGVKGEKKREACQWSDCGMGRKNTNSLTHDSQMRGQKARKTLTRFAKKFTRDLCKQTIRDWFLSHILIQE